MSIWATSRTQPDRDRNRAELTSGLVAVVVFLTAIAPLATDMYVTAFPRVASDLSGTASQVQKQGLKWALSTAA